MKKGKVKNINIKRSIGVFKLNVFLSVVFAFVLLILTNFCASRIYVRYHYDSLISQGLSQQSIDILQKAEGEIKIISIFERSHHFRKPARRLLKEYKELSNQISHLNIDTQTIDANLDISEAAKILKKYNAEVNSIIIIKGSEYDCFSEDELASNTTLSLENHSNPASYFNGEFVCTPAIHKLLHTESSKIYFLSGHGEYDPTSADKHTGASNLARLLELYNNDIKILQVSNKNRMFEIPDDCNILAIAGPTTMFTEIEIKAISDYLDDGGSALFLFNNENANGLSPLLNKWNIQLNTPADSYISKISSTTSTIYNKHAITEPLDNIATTFSNPAFLTPTTDIHLTTKELADKPQFTPLVFTEPSEHHSGSPNVIAAAVQLGKPYELGRKQTTRIVVCGDASIISNAMVGPGTSGNKLFLFSAIEWLKGNAHTNKMIPAETTILNSGIPSNGWSSLLINLAVFLPLSILLFGVFFISPLLKRI